MSHLQSVFGALSESNQQQQQQQQQGLQQNSNFCQPMQTKPSGLMNQQSNLCQTQPQQQPMQQPCNNSYFPTNEMPTSMPCHNNNNNAFMQASMPTPAPTACYLPQNVLDQLRCLASSNSTPIFILPAGLASNSNSSSSPCVTPCFSPTCIPYPMPMPIYQPFASNTSSSENECCKCTSNSSSNSRTQSQSQESSEPYSSGITWNADQHICKEGSEGTVCSKKSCPASIQLQAMISQLLAYQGVIPSAMTRILLKRVPGSNVSESVDEIMEKAMRCIRQQPKDALLREACNSREVTKLLSLYLTSSSTLPRIIPVLTTVQLKCNILKAAVENLVSSRLMEEQSNCGVESEDPLDRMLLELKPEDELRQMLSALRERECEERVNINFASCATQKRIAEARLATVQRKIMMVEAEMMRRRDSYGSPCGRLSNHANSRQLSAIICGDPSPNRHYHSPDPFEGICVTSPKRLLLKPHVGSPQTTYEKPKEDDGSCRCKDEQLSDDPCKENAMDAEEEVKVQDCAAEEEVQGSKDDDMGREEAAGNEGNGVEKVGSEVKDLFTYVMT